MFEPLDPLLHNQLRLQIMSLLIGIENAEFGFLLDETGSTRGNLSVQLNKLKEAGYIEIEKGYKGNYPNTKYSISKLGQEAFANYFEALQSYKP
jgi:DNA-binding transcriptional ArsR family regulator